MQTNYSSNTAHTAAFFTARRDTQYAIMLSASLSVPCLLFIPNRKLHKLRVLFRDKTLDRSNVWWSKFEVKRSKIIVALRNLFCAHLRQNLIDLHHQINAKIIIHSFHALPCNYTLPVKCDLFSCLSVYLFVTCLSFAWDWNVFAAV